MKLLVGVVLAAGCGSVVKGKPDAPPAQSDASVDSPGSCTVHDQVSSCGATCAVCTAASDRQMATCDGTSCGTACAGGNPTCSDNSCSRLAFTFDNDTEGATVVTPAGMVPALRMHNGSMALAFDFTTNLATQQLEFHVPVCLTGTINESTKTLTASVYFEGGNDTGPQYYIQGWVPTPANSANNLSTQQAAHNVANVYSAPMSMSVASNNFNNITFRIGSFGAAFVGTIWVDDIAIQ